MPMYTRFLFACLYLDACVNAAVVRDANADNTKGRQNRRAEGILLNNASAKQETQDVSKMTVSSKRRPCMAPSCTVSTRCINLWMLVCQR